MDEYNDRLEDTTTIEVYLEFIFEDWPLLAGLEEPVRQRLCTAVSEALNAAECPVQAIRAKADTLRIVVKLNENLSMDDMADIVENTARVCISSTETAPEPIAYSAECLSPEDVIDAVLRLH